MRRLVKTVGSIGLMAALWGCSSSSDDTAASTGGSGGAGGAGAAAGSGAAGSSSAGTGATTSGGSAGTSAGASGGESGEGGAATGGEAGVAGATTAGSGGATAGSGGATAGSGGDTGGTAGTGGSGGAAAGTGGSGGASAGTGGDSAGTGGATAGSGGSAGSGPAAVSAITIDTTTSEFAVDVTWTDSTNDATGFNVYFSTDDTQPSTPTATVAAGSTEYKLTQVQGGATYRVWVEAMNAAGTSAAIEGIAAAATTDLIWDDLWLDDSGTIHLAIEDTLGFLTDSDDTTGLYAYQSASATDMGSALAIDPTLLLDVTSAAIDTTAVHYFWTEARTANGSLFSLRTLAPAGAVTTLAATPSTASVDLSWDVTASANGYQVFFGTDTQSDSTRANDASTNAATVSSLASGMLYSFWVRATSAAIGGNGFPGPFATVQATTTQ